MTKVMFGEYIKAPNDIHEVDLPDLFKFMYYSEKLEWLTEDIRNAPNKEERNKLKQELNYFIPSIINGKRHVDNFVKSELMILDIDGLSSEELPQLRNNVKKNKYVHFAFTSPSGNGLKVGFRLERYITSAKLYTQVYRYLSKVFNSHYKVECDKTSDAVRACYLSYDENLYYNPESKAWPIRIEPEKKRPVPNLSVKNDGDAEFNKALEIALNNTANNYADWVTCGIALKNHFGEKGLDIFKALSMGKGYSDSEKQIEWKWKTFPDNASVNLGSFFHLLK